MITIKKEISERKAILEQIILEKEAALVNAPDGMLHIIKHNCGHQYYLRTGSDDKNGKYIRKSEISLIRALAQKTYNEQVLKQAQNEVKLLSRLEKLYNDRCVEEVYLYLSDARKELVVPVEEPIEEYCKKWNSEKYKRLEMDFETELYTDKGEKVRSKSEILIANYLLRAQIPYIYERQLLIGNNEIYPDFTILDTRRRREIYWEHFGLMDDENYREKAFNKINKYEQNGIFVGDRLIVTFETIKHPLNTKVLEKKIEYIKTMICTE